jgi:hypothetical protein
MVTEKRTKGRRRARVPSSFPNEIGYSRVQRRSEEGGGQLHLAPAVIKELQVGYFNDDQHFDRDIFCFLKN